MLSAYSSFTFPGTVKLKGFLYSECDSKFLPNQTQNKFWSQLMRSGDYFPKSGLESFISKSVLSIMYKFRSLFWLCPIAR